jgi:hypothetical protein
MDKDILSKAIVATNGELAWKRVDLALAIDELIKSGKEIFGGEIWAVMPIETDSSITKMRTSMQINDGRLALGLIPDKNGMDGVYNWDCEPRGSESLVDYARKTKEKTFEMIDKMNPENDVSPEFAQLLYYNLTHS